MPAPLTKEDLDSLTCVKCGQKQDHECESELFFHATCHHDNPPWMYYKDGILTILCSVCEKEVAQISVASSILEALFN